MNYSYRPANREERACFRRTEERFPPTGRRNKDERPSPRVSAGHRAARRTQVRPESQNWQAEQDLFLASRSRFVGIAYNILGNREDAEDAVQDALVSAYRHRDKFEGRSAFKTWFTRIVLNAALMMRRRRKPSWIEPLPKSFEVDETPWTERIPASQPDPEMVHSERETFELIDGLLGKMSPLLRQAFTMTYFDEMSNEEAGAVLGVTTGTFKSRLLRARRHLMERTQRTEVAPMRRAAHSLLVADKRNFQSLAANRGAMPISEGAFS